MRNNREGKVLAVIMISLFLINTGTSTLAQEDKTHEIVEDATIDNDTREKETEDTFAKRRELLVGIQPNIPKLKSGTSRLGTGIKVQEAELEDLKRTVLGEGVTISNFKMQGDYVSFGTFSNGASSLGIDEGIVLSTGDAMDLETPNSPIRALSSNLESPGDSTLSHSVGGAPTFDAAVIEFDFVSKGDNLKFEYVFGSEEYNNYVGDVFNDAFGYFLDGENLAVLPGTNTIVSIATVNGGRDAFGERPAVPASNREYFRVNSIIKELPGPYATEPIDNTLNGLTTVLPVYTKLIPGKTYHMKLVIADVYDTSVDSAVFIKANSFSSTYDVSYLSGGGSGTPPANGQAVFGEEYTVATPTELSKPNHAFIGWESSADGKIYPAGTKLKLTADTIFTARWKVSTGNITLSYQDMKGKEFVGVGITSDTQPIDANVSYPVPDLSPDYVLAKVSGADWVSEDEKTFWVNFKEGTRAIVLTYATVGKVNVKYVNENRQPITPPAGTNAPVLLRQEVGKSLTEAVPNFLPLHEIVAVEGATLSADKKNYVINKFTEADQTVTLVYKEIPQEVKMTIKYLMDQTKNDVIDLATQTKVPDVVKTVTIGQPISGYSHAHQRDIDGYTYKSVTGNAGNVPKEDFTVTYYYEGKLGLENVPKVVDFGQDNRLITVGKQKVFPVTPIQVDVLDTRDSNNQSWQLQLKVLEPIQTANNQLLKGSLKFNQGGNIITLTETGQVVKNQGIKVLGREKITWSTEDGEGLYLEQEPGNLKDVAYKGKVSWQLTDGL